MNRTSRTFGIVLLAIVTAATATVYAAKKGKGGGAAPPPPATKVADVTPSAEQLAAIAKPVPGWKDKDSPATVALTPEVVQDPKGDGPDGKGNTDDDTWGFWFQLVHDANSYRRLDLCTKTMPENQRANGVVDPSARPGHTGKVRGPIAGHLPNREQTEGYIYHSDWDGRFEGAWGDKKANCVMLHPYVEKVSHASVALTYRVPATGTYTISGKVTDLQPLPPGPKADGIIFHVEVVDASSAVEIKRLAVGDADPTIERPNSADFKIEKVNVGGGRLLRFVVDPNHWWGTDLTRLDLKIEKAK